MSQKLKFSDLSPHEFETITALGLTDNNPNIFFQRMSARAGDVLFAPGDTSAAYLIVMSGQIRVELTTKADREIVLYRVRTAQTCLITTTALLRSEVYFASGVAETDIEALALPATCFETALRHCPDFAAFILGDYARRVESLVGLIDRLTSKNIDHDLGAQLLGAMDASGNVHLTQADLARNIGTAREVVSRKLAAFERRGMIKRARGRITVLDKDGFM